MDILSSALLEASSIIHKQSQKKSLKMKANASIDDDNRTSSSSGSKTDSSVSADNMDHLDVDFLPDWVTRFRRRSSNLSDFGSRRSSCSTRYSSDFSSEFEEYYENFQKREQQVIHKTITEEICHPAITDYAANLVAKLLSEGTSAAVSYCKKVQKFDDSIPCHIDSKPKAYKASGETDVNITVSVEQDVPTSVNQTVAEKYADSLLSKLLVFPNGGPNMSLQNDNSRNISSSGQCIPISPRKSLSDVSSVGSQRGVDEDILSGLQTLTENDLCSTASEIVQSAISSAVMIYSNPTLTSSVNDGEREDQVAMASSYSSKHSTDSELSQASSAPGSSFFQNRGLYESSEKADNTYSEDKVQPVVDTSASPSKGEKKNVQFHKNLVQRESDKTDLADEILSDVRSKSISHSRTVSESSTSIDSPVQQLAIPKLIVSDELSHNGVEEIYGRVAEKLILTGFSGALKDIQEQTGKTYEGAALTFSSTNSQPEHSVYVQGGNLVYSGEILRGDSYEDVHNPQRVNCFASTLSRDLLTNAFIEVQRNANGGCYARRSSEPLKISNQAARQLMEENNGLHGYKEKSKSRTEEDIGTFAVELAQNAFDEDFPNFFKRSRSGFRDPTLSR